MTETAPLQRLIFTNDPFRAIDEEAGRLRPDRAFVLTDVNTASYVLPRLQALSAVCAEAEIITVKAGDINKDLDNLSAIWKRLTDSGATRHSLMINAGGGVVTDMGAFAASTFKRGIRFINLPTSLLGAVDASVGGKTGINFAGLKNLVGSFSNADSVILSTVFFNTLDSNELRSGYGEMLKHALLSSEKDFSDILAVDITDCPDDILLDLLRRSVLFKKSVVGQDPLEGGLRRILNLGHTAGHAFESLALKRRLPIPHGYAVAYGLITALVLSHICLKFPSEAIHRLAANVRSVFGPFEFTCDDYPDLLGFMGQDKKNPQQGKVNFTLLEAIGKPRIDCIVGRDDIVSALDITRDFLGI